MKVTNYGAACALIETPDVRVLCDPWWTEGVYDGSWYRYKPPPVFDEPVDAIWISHLHPDHYDPVFLRAYLSTHAARLLVAKQSPPHLEQMMRAHGFDPEPTDLISVGDTNVHVFAADTQPAQNIDSVLLVTHGNQSVLNLNDCGTDPVITEAVQALVGKPTVALVPFTGAGPFPQCFRFDSELHRLQFAQLKHRVMVDKFAQVAAAWDAEFSVPFAGQYVLGGKNAGLNLVRGHPDPTECEGATVLADGGTLDLDSGEADITDVAVDGRDLTDFALTTAGRPMAWESLTGTVDLALVQAAHEKALTKIRYTQPRWVTLNDRFVLDLANPIVFVASGFDKEPRTELEVDERYLHGLLTRKFHWNNAEVGSNMRWFRAPMDEYEWGVTLFLSYLHV